MLVWPVFLSLWSEANMQLGQSVADFFGGYFSTHDRRNKTKAAYRSDLAQFRTFAGEDLALASMGSALIEKWAAHLQAEKYSPASIRRKIVVLKVFCSYWVRRGVLRESPFWRVKISFGRIQQLPRTLTETETRALMSRARRSGSGWRPNGATKRNPKSLSPSHSGYRNLR